MAKEIALSRGLVTLVDDADFEWLSERSWYAHKTTCGWYARGGQRTDGGPKHVFMHHLLMPPPAGQMVDHINRDKLDNRRANLRLATRAQNVWNRELPPGAVPFRGVHRQGGRFVAQIAVHGSKQYLGRFDTAEAAARAYDAAARDRHGEFAVLNFPDLEVAA